WPAAAPTGRSSPRTGGRSSPSRPRRPRRARGPASGCRGNELERSRVHAVAEPRRLRPVAEDVPEVSLAARADDLSPVHEERVVGTLDDRLLRDGLPEARPARAGFELRFGAEELLRAARAYVRALGMVVPELTRERTLRALPAQDLVLHGREHLLPFGVGDGPPLRVRLHRRAHGALRSCPRLGLRRFGRGHPASEPRPERGESDQNVATCAHGLHFITAVPPLPRECTYDRRSDKGGPAPVPVVGDPLRQPRVPLRLHGPRHPVPALGAPAPG